MQHSLFVVYIVENGCPKITYIFKQGKFKARFIDYKRKYEKYEVEYEAYSCHSHGYNSVTNFSKTKYILPGGCVLEALL